MTWSAQGQAPPIRIMPLGDSITDGTSAGTAGQGGYRGTLYTALTAAGYNVDYIGSLTNNGSGIPDKDHEGHSGWRIDQLDSNMEGWFNSMADPDVVLMHIGTNDFGQNNDTVNAINRLDALILKITTLRPYAHVIVTNLMARGEPQNAAIQAQFNPSVQSRVNAHAAAGRRVTFLDMRAAVPLSDMPDNLHPNQTGYNKMANAWLPAIQAVISPEGDAAAPAIVRARGTADQTQVAITFSKPIADAAAVPGNFTISGGLTVSAASLDAAKRTITLTTGAQNIGTTYTVTVNGVTDRLTPVPGALAADTTVQFQPAIPRGYLNHVPEASAYTLAASLDVPNAAFWRNADPAYSVDNRSRIGEFDRVAYYVELQTAAGQLQYLWASMNAFTTDTGKLAVPTVASGAVIQQPVSGMTVVSNVGGILNGENLVGNLEFWPTNYDATNSASVAGASGTFYDFGDRPTPGTYGSMQLHHAGSAQTLFALNNWGHPSNTNPGNLDIGIGTDPAPVNNGRDYTFHHNAANYSVKTIQVLVRTTGDLTPPTLTSAQATYGRTQLVVGFSEPLSPSSVQVGGFTLSGGASVLSAQLQPNQRDVLLTTTALPASTLTLTVNGVRDSSANANPIASGSTIPVAPAALPQEIQNNIGAAANGYELVYSADLPVIGNFNALGAAAYRLNDSAASGNFRRVAYYLELQQPGGPVNYVWASMDSFTGGRKGIGVPTVAAGSVFQQNVTNLEVVSNVAGVVNGTTATGGNIEFWPQDYTVGNGANVPNASASTFDFGDTRTASGGNNFGSMQIHNHDAGAAQTVMAINHFGSDGNVLDIGIGNSPENPDWTFAANAASYSRRVLHVLVLPGNSTDPALVTKVPEAANYQLVYSLNLPSAGNLVSGNGFTNYSVNHSASIGGFSRIGYYMELQKTTDSEPQYIWTSMDAFTDTAGRIGVPTTASGAVFQQKVNNLNVFSNVAGVNTGTGIATGNIEFWPNNYTQGLGLADLGGSGTVYDFNDTRSTTGSHGSMQIHNYGAGKTLWALNNWGTSGNTANVFGLGIGNNPNTAQAPDYTSTANAASYNLKRLLQVYVMPGASDLVPPAVVSTVGSTTLNRLIVTFNEPVSDSSATAANFSIPGLTVSRAELLASKRDVAVFTSAQTGGQTYTVNLSGIRDRSASGNLLATGSTSFTAWTPPAILANVPETSGYKLVNQLAIPSASPQWNNRTIPYSVEEAKYGPQQFDRVAYLMQLDTDWVYASFDRHTPDIAKVGVPTLTVSPTPLQQIVTSMNVASSVPGITTGTGITTGNIEFWGGNYTGANALAIPGANGTTFDFGDQMTAGGHGSMQIHNYGASQVLMAYNNWGGNAGQTSDTGIGNHPSPSATASNAQLDWTFSNSASTRTVRNLYVLVRPGGTAQGTAPVFQSHPASRNATAGDTVSLSAIATGAEPLTYQWRKGGVPIPGETSPWLDLPSFSASGAGSYDVVVTASNLVSTTSQPAAVTLNTPPVFSGYSFTAVKEQPTPLLIAKILSAVTDAEGGPLSVTSAAHSSQGGTIAQTADSLLYTSADGYTGTDTFSITISDDQGATASGTVTVIVTSQNPSTNQASLVINGNGTVEVLFYGIPGRTYQLQRSTDLINWTTLATTAAAADGTLPLLDSNPPADEAFYRTRQVD